MFSNRRTGIKSLKEFSESALGVATVGVAQSAKKRVKGAHCECERMNLKVKMEREEMMRCDAKVLADYLMLR